MKNNFFRNLFGAILPPKKPKHSEQSPVIANPDDGSIFISTQGYQQHVKLNYEFVNEVNLINFYREMSYYSDVDMAIEDIINEMIIGNEDEGPVNINLDRFTDINIGISTKEKIRTEFKYILKLLDFNKNCYDIAKRLYIDGRLYFHVIVKADARSEGIVELRYIDPRKIRKVRIIHSTPERSGNSSINIVDEYEEYFLFNPDGLTDANALAQALIGGKIDPSAITFVHSGLIEPASSTIYSYLHKAIKPYNQLRLLEDSAVIYRLVRAPERKIFNVYTGNLPPDKAEAYMKDQMNMYRNNDTYNTSTGSMSSQQLTMSIIDDIWLPKGENGEGTTIDSLSGGATLGEMDDIIYFQKKLYKALNVPISRLESDTGFSIGRASEISRDEIKFRKFIDKLQKRFSLLFDDLLGKQLVLKGICTQSEWDNIKDDIVFEFKSDSYFAELKEAEMIRERIALAQDMGADLSEYFSKEYIQKQILKHTEDTIEDMQDEIIDEIEADPLDDEIEDSEISFEKPSKRLSGMDDIDTSFSDSLNKNKEIINNNEDDETEEEI